jgi:hypothetical protein
MTIPRNCKQYSVILFGSGIHNNAFKYLTLHTMSDSIYIDGFNGTSNPELSSLISHNSFANIEIGGPLTVLGNCSANTFNQIVALQNPLSSGGEVPADLGYYGYAPRGCCKTGLAVGW